MIRRFLPFLPLATALGGCFFNANPPYLDEFTKDAPKPADLVGTYSLSDETLSYGDPYKPGTVLRAQDGKTASIHQLILRDNGTFSAVNIPLWAELPTTEWKIKSFQSGTGTWSVEGTTDWSFGFSPKPKLIPNDNRTFIQLLGQSPPYTILFFYGHEPDDDAAMLFTKDN